MLNIEDTGCCAVQEIENLSSEPDAKTAMKHWCEQELLNNESKEDRDDRDFWGYEEDAPERKDGWTPYAFYVFTGVVKHTDGTKVKHEGKYGPNFAALIKTNKLGKLTESVSRSNRVNHPSHHVKIWTWAPSIKNCKLWYKKEFEGVKI